jgi:hypothetical protein
LFTIPVPPKSLNTLTNVVLEILRHGVFAGGSTGVVFAGFGASDPFPALVEVTVDDIVANKLRWTMLRKLEISHSNQALLIPFAQSEMVYTFMEGIDPALDELTKSVVEKVLLSLPDEIDHVSNISARSRNKIRQHFKSHISALLPSLWDQLKGYRHQVFSGPVSQIISHLPKDELGAMAEALVNLTSFRRRVSTDRETVGGPIDVAVITRGDGFVWIKRKHYFDPDLNPRQIAQLYRGTP